MLVDYDKIIFDLPETGGRRAYFKEGERLTQDVENWLGQDHVRQSQLDLPNLAEIQVVRHYTNLSSKNYGVDNGPYTLGSCTMKYNPKVNEDVVALPGLSRMHPLQPCETVQGTLKLLYTLSSFLGDIMGMEYATLQPAAGAHGELTGVMLIRSYHEDRGDAKRKYMLIPDSAHGTNPASAVMAGFKVREVKSNAQGEVDLEDLKSKLGDDVAGMMLTNPNTLGVYETQIGEITKLVHDAGGLMYYDGANLNAIMLHSRPGDMGFDVCHWNVHKTLSTPHGGGGPGAGPVGCKDFLAPYLPTPVLAKADDHYYWDWDRPKSYGRVRSFYGATAVLLRALSYILANGAQGLSDVSEAAVANANFVYQQVRDLYNSSSDSPIMHEFVITAERQKQENGITATDIAKRLIDYGIHPPTIYFPLTVPEAMMVEPTDTETKEGLDQLVTALRKIAEEAKTNPELLQEAPHKTPIYRPDEIKAATELNLSYRAE